EPQGNGGWVRRRARSTAPCAAAARRALPRAAAARADPRREAPAGLASQRGLMRRRARTLAQPWDVPLHLWLMGARIFSSTPYHACARRCPTAHRNVVARGGPQAGRSVITGGR